MKMTQEQYDALKFAVQDLRYWEDGELQADMVKLLKEAQIDTDCYDPFDEFEAECFDKETLVAISGFGIATIGLVTFVTGLCIANETATITGLVLVTTGLLGAFVALRTK